MNISELSYHLGKLDRRIEEVYDLWIEIPLEIRDKIEKLFENDQGVGYHIYRAWENVRDVNDEDMEKIYEEE